MKLTALTFITILTATTALASYPATIIDNGQPRPPATSQNVIDACNTLLPDNEARIAELAAEWQDLSMFPKLAWWVYLIQKRDDASYPWIIIKGPDYTVPTIPLPLKGVAREGE